MSGNPSIKLLTDNGFVVVPIFEVHVAYLNSKSAISFSPGRFCY
jgi:hypothetical protein